MKVKHIFLITLLLALLLTGTACKKEKYYLEIHNTEARLDDSIFYGRPQVVAKVRITDIKDSYFTNPDGPYEENVQVTVYDAEVSETLRGTLNETVQIKVYNGEGMSPDLYLYGEDDQYILENKEEPFLLSQNQEYILGLIYMEDYYGDNGGYTVPFGKLWCFTQNSEGIYENGDTGLNSWKLDVESMKNNLRLFSQNEGYSN